jgi:UDP-N-acetylmuramyl pentapeptide phosphotransferase/UDP-N-acetylglucosamine-1-phosphate transferase
LNIYLALGLFSVCSAGAVLFLKLARMYGLHDHPGGRSSHWKPTVTGMGLIVALSLITYLFWHPYQLPEYFVAGFFIISAVSFLDDLFFLKHSFRLLVQMLTMAMLMAQMPFHSFGAEVIPIYLASFIFGIGVLNAYNFMDGVNGMLTLHALLVFSGLYYLNQHITDMQGNAIPFTDSNFILSIIIPLAIFGFFNIRRSAIAFMGDVGSISIAFITVFLIYSLIFKTGNYMYLLMFSVFGADAALTVCYKLLLGENIFVPHRDFLFKKLVHIGKWSHLKVSFWYFAVQAIINLIVIGLFPTTPKLSTQISVLFIGCILLIGLYVYVQSRMPRKQIARSKP